MKDATVSTITLQEGNDHLLHWRWQYPTSVSHRHIPHGNVNLLILLSSIILSIHSQCNHKMDRTDQSIYHSKTNGKFVICQEGQLHCKTRKNWYLSLLIHWFVYFLSFWQEHNNQHNWKSNGSTTDGWLHGACILKSISPIACTICWFLNEFSGFKIINEHGATIN